MTSELTPLEKDIMSNIKARNESMLSIKTLTLRYAFLEHDQELLLQYSMVMVYSIWEGFIQTAFQTYVRELNKLGLTVDTVCKPILVYQIESKFKQFKQYPKLGRGDWRLQPERRCNRLKPRVSKSEDFGLQQIRLLYQKLYASELISN